jgi:hypothetical protein
VRQGQFLVCWKKGSCDRGDCFSKHHPTSHHRAVLSSYPHAPNDRSRNCFECLQDTETGNLPAASRSVTFADQTAPKSARGEGALISTSPKVTRTSVPRATQTTQPHNLCSSTFDDILLFNSRAPARVHCPPPKEPGFLCPEQR